MNVSGVQRGCAIDAPPVAGPSILIHYAQHLRFAPALPSNAQISSSHGNRGTHRIYLSYISVIKKNHATYICSYV